jgi:hypothetical protein
MDCGFAPPIFRQNITLAVKERVPAGLRVADVGKLSEFYTQGGRPRVWTMEYTPAAGTMGNSWRSVYL